MRTSNKGLVALMGREAVVLSTYEDTKGIPTIGVGHTAAAGEPNPAPGLKISLRDALDIFHRDIVKYEDAVNAAVKVPLAQHEFDALVSFQFNTGGIAKAQLTRRLNDDDREGAAQGFLGWLRPPEIEGRRRAEMRQFATGDYGNLDTILIYETFPGKPKPTSTAGLI